MVRFGGNPTFTGSSDIEIQLYLVDYPTKTTYYYENVGLPVYRWTVEWTNIPTTANHQYTVTDA